MTIRGWKTRYREIRNVFGYRKYDDLISAKKLNSKIGKRYPLSNIKKTIRGQTVFIIGAGPSLSRSISTLKKYQNITNETKLFLNNSIHRREDAVINSM